MSHFLAQGLARKWMELEKTILREITQTQEDKCQMFSLIRGSRFSDISVALISHREISLCNR